jgi:hypothetical protein
VGQPRLNTCFAEAKVNYLVSLHKGRIVIPTPRLSTSMPGHPIVDLVPQSSRRCTPAPTAAAAMAVAQCSGHAKLGCAHLSGKSRLPRILS